MGGSGSVGFQVAHAIQRYGYRSFFLSYDHPFKYLPEDTTNPTFYNVEPYAYPLFPFPLYELSLAERIATVVCDQDIDIIHVHYGILFAHAALQAQAAVRATGRDVKVVTTFHGSDVLGFDLQHPGSVAPKHLNKLVVTESDAITFVSHDLREWSERLYGHNPTTAVIPNGVDIARFSPPTHHRNGTHIVHISNYRPVKQTTMIPEIFAYVLHHHPEATLTLVGDGPDLSGVHQQLRDLGIPPDRYNLVGKMHNDALIQTLRTADVLLLPSQYESFSLVALEAQACGVPVVAARVGGLPTVVADTRTGQLLDDAADVTEYGQAICELFADDHTHTEFRQAARAHAEQFAEPAITQQYTTIYQQLK